MFWHRFPERTPEEGVLLLVYCNKRVKVARYIEGKFFDSLMLEIPGIVTYWSKIIFPSESPDGWLPCIDDKSPKHGELVLVCSDTEKKAETAEYDRHAKGYFDAIGDGLRFTPTHWRSVQIYPMDHLHHRVICSSGADDLV